MKINEKTLIRYATSSTTPTDMQGDLYKRGEVNRSFQKRWCVLKGNLFYYFEKKVDREPIGCIILEGCRIELAEGETDLHSFNIVFSGASSRTYTMGTESQESMESWMKALSSASYDYLKLVVAELQKQLDEINDNDKKKLMHSALAASCPTTSRVNPFDKDGELINLDFPGTSHPQAVIFTKRPFAEIHEFYGRQYRRYRDEEHAKNSKPDEESGHQQNGHQNYLLNSIL